MTPNDLFTAALGRVGTSPGRDERERVDIARAQTLFGRAGSGGLTASRGHALTAGVFDARERAARASGDRDRALQIARDRKALVDWAVSSGVTELEFGQLASKAAPHIEALERNHDALVPANAKDRAAYDRHARALAEAREAMPGRVYEQLREQHGDGASLVINRAKAVAAAIEAASPTIGAALKFSGAGNDRDVIETLANIGERIAKP